MLLSGDDGTLSRLQNSSQPRDFSMQVYYLVGKCFGDHLFSGGCKSAHETTRIYETICGDASWRVEPCVSTVKTPPPIYTQMPARPQSCLRAWVCRLKRKKKLESCPPNEMPMKTTTVLCYPVYSAQPQLEFGCTITSFAAVSSAFYTRQPWTNSKCPG